MMTENVKNPRNLHCRKLGPDKLGEKLNYDHVGVRACLTSISRVITTCSDTWNIYTIKNTWKKGRESQRPRSDIYNYTYLCHIWRNRSVRKNSNSWKIPNSKAFARNNVEMHLIQYYMFMSSCCLRSLNSLLNLSL